MKGGFLDVHVSSNTYHWPLLSSITDSVSRIILAGEVVRSYSVMDF